MRERLMMMMTVAAALGAGAVEYRWTGKLQEPAPYNVPVWQGDTVVLAPLLESYGKTAVPVSATLYWQTNGMGAAWFEKPADIAPDGRIRAVFHPTNDFGANAYSYFIGTELADGLAYRIGGTLNMRPSPGFKPNTIKPPVPYLDFNLIEYLNAPWLLPSALEGYATELWVENYVAENAPTLTEADPVALPVAVAASNLAANAWGRANTASNLASQAWTLANGKASPQEVEAIIAGKGFVVNGQDGAAFGKQVSVGDAHGFPFSALNGDGSVFLAAADDSLVNYFETWYTPWGIRSRRYLEADGWDEKVTEFRLPVRHEGVVTLATEEWAGGEFAKKSDIPPQFVGASVVDRYTNLDTLGSYSYPAGGLSPLVAGGLGSNIIAIGVRYVYGPVKRLRMWRLQSSQPIMSDYLGATPEVWWLTFAQVNVARSTLQGSTSNTICFNQMVQYATQLGQSGACVKTPLTTLTIGTDYFDLILPELTGSDGRTLILLVKFTGPFSYAPSQVVEVLGE